ncbi:anthranilate synthase component I family protein [Candidatus Hadarchaeum sp.]|uniref:anthranilate synthase component I family protein n=1 Tax=Candidatus Hadarchaeum sp. TaxID=2883567 RepID=UPI00319D9520
MKLAEEIDRPGLLPLVYTADKCPDPAKLYFGLRRRSSLSYLLESARGQGEISRYSVLGCDPLLYLKVKTGKCQILGRQDFVDMVRRFPIRENEDPLKIFERIMLLKKMRFPKGASRYMLGIVGYISYDYVRTMFNVGMNAADDLKQPQLELMLPERMVIIDHFAHKTHYCSLLALSDTSDPQLAFARAKSKLEDLVTIKENDPKIENLGPISIRSNFTREEYERQVNRAKEYIRSGDIIQVVLSRRIEFNSPPPLEHFFLNLRKINPSPYMFFLDFPERCIVGSSPEILLRVCGRKVITRPIAGTRRRGTDREDDDAMEQDLCADEKERAEHTMLVDLGRNDLGRVSKFGSIKVTSFMKVEKYSQVQHLVSNIEGELREDADALDAFRAAFPAGTVTGAPKLRAMEIIEELEPVRRGIYAGAIGTFSYIGDADFAITIRTLVCEKSKAYVQVGAGIVADSVPWKEYYETENKARALLMAAGLRSG